MSIDNRESYIDNLDTNIMPFIQYPEYPDRYPALSIQKLSEEFYSELRYASKIIFSAFCKVVKEVQNKIINGDYTVLKDLGINKKLFPYMNIPNKLALPTWLSRFDYILDKDYNIKLVEINADTPCAFVESYYGNKIACDYFNAKNPNQDSYKELVSFMKSVSDIMIKQIDLSTGNFNNSKPFLFSCFDDYLEDLGTTLFLMKAMNESKKSYYSSFDTRFESFYKLFVDEEGLILSDGIRPQAIYRMHPMELLIEEKDVETDFELGKYFMDKYKEGKFIMMNPPESIIMQSKAFLSLVYGIARLRDTDILSSEEIAVILNYMLPTFLDFNDIPKYSIDKWIKKPVFGREGLDIEILNMKRDILNKTEKHDKVPTINDDIYIFQKYIENQPIFEEDTDSGIKEGYLTLSCFMLGTNPSAVYGRFADDAICSTDAYWLPLAEL